MGETATLDSQPRLVIQRDHEPFVFPTLQAIRTSNLTMPSFGIDMSLSGVQKVEDYCDADLWGWHQHSYTHRPSYSCTFNPSKHANSVLHLQPLALVLPLYHSIATSRVISTGFAAQPFRMVGNMAKAHSAFKSTWKGFLDTTEDAMIVVEAALQERLSPASHRPCDKERAEILTSGTVIVYEENASGIKRWNDAVHWSPSRVLNNYLIYRQLVRARTSKEKKLALNQSCSTKRKRKGSAEPAVTKISENVYNSGDEYKISAFDCSLTGDANTIGKVYSKFVQSLTPNQQRRFCGSLINCYGFKEGGLMKKAISVKYQGTHHHVISYYTIEDAVSGKLKRPFQDPKLADIQPRHELLTGWKVSLEDEKNKYKKLVADCPQHIQPSHLQRHAIGVVTKAVGVHGFLQTGAPLHSHAPEYCHEAQTHHYAQSHRSPQQYSSPQSVTPQYASPQPAHQYSTQPPPSGTYSTEQTSTLQYVQPFSPQHYVSPQPASQQFPVQTTAPPQYVLQPQHSRQHAFDQQPTAPAPHCSQQATISQYPASQHPQVTPPRQCHAPSAPKFYVQVPVSQSATSAQQPSQGSAQQYDPHRRVSALVAYSQPQHHASPPPHFQYYYVADLKYTTNPHHSS